MAAGWSGGRVHLQKKEEKRNGEAGGVVLVFACLHDNRDLEGAEGGQCWEASLRSVKLSSPLLQSDSSESTVKPVKPIPPSPSVRPSVRLSIWALWPLQPQLLPPCPGSAGGGPSSAGGRCLTAALGSVRRNSRCQVIIGCWFNINPVELITVFISQTPLVSMEFSSCMVETRHFVVILRRKGNWKVNNWIISLLMWWDASWLINCSKISTLTLYEK